MVDDVFYKNYKALKDNFNVGYKGYQLKGIMAKDFIFFAYKMDTYKLTKSSIKWKLFFAQDLQDFQDLLSQKKVMFSFDNYGNDYKFLLDSIREQLDESVLFEPKNEFKKHIHLGNIIVSFFQLFVFSKLKSISLKDRFYFFLVLVQYKNTIDLLELNKNNVNTTKFVPFLSCFPIDSILSQFFRKRNIKSYGIQHGLHCSSIDYKTYIPYDVMNIENLQADYILAWGNFTKEALLKEGKSEAQFLLAGAPKYTNIDRIDIKKSNTNRCVLCLARDIYSEGNILLLTIAKEMIENGMEVHLKFHPRSDLKKYESKLKSFDFKILDIKTTIDRSISIVNPDFVIVYNSTVYYEYYIKGIITLRFGVYQNDIPFGLDDEFSSFNELKTLLQKIENQNNENINNDVNAMINRFCALGLDNYRKILN